MARPTYCEIDLEQLASNLQAIRSHVGQTKILALVKADAYGHGLVPVAQKLSEQGIDYFGVAALEEGVTLRENGIREPILCLGPLPHDSESLCVEYKIEQTVSTAEAIRRLEEYCNAHHTRAGVQIKIETGMHRTGVCPGSDLENVLQSLRAASHLSLTGVFTHFYDADAADPAHTHQQAKIFFDAVAQIKAFGFRDFLVHCANSAGILAFPEYHCDMVRAGIILYGYAPSNEIACPISVKPFFSLKTAVVALENVSKGETISYGGTFCAERDMRVAVLPIGYGDGYFRRISNRGHVLVNGKKAPVTGRVCMDMTMVDVTDIPDVAIGTPVTVLGAQGENSIDADEIAAWCDTISYEIMLSFTQRVPKKYTGGKST